MSVKNLKVIERPASSLEPLRVPVFAEENGAVFVPTAMTVEMGFVKEDFIATPAVEPSTWTTGVWDVDASTSTVVYRAQAKPLGLTSGRYTVWLRLTGTDTPKRIVGILSLL